MKFYLSFASQEDAEKVSRERSNWNHFASPEKHGTFWVVRIWDEHGNSWYA